MGFSAISFVFVFALIASVQQAGADSFMEKWFAGQQAKLAQIGVPSVFDKDGWLARQQGTDQAVAEASSSETADLDGSLTQGDWRPAAPWEQKIEDLEQSLLSEIERDFGKDHRRDMESRIVIVEEAMKPMYRALPKNEYELLGHSSVRYMLHRFFVDQHGWFIDGLFTEGAALNASSPSHALKGRVPMFVEHVFSQRLGVRGFGIHDLAVLVAVVEDSINQEAQGELKNTFKVLGYGLDKLFDDESMEMVVELYMAGFIMETNMSSVKAPYLRQLHATMPTFYPTWPMAREYFRKVQKKTSCVFASCTFADVSIVVKELVDTFGTFHGKQCMGLKETLKDLEGVAKTGCVNLPDFYQKGLKADSNWMFVESPDYLRQIGVLDETEPKNPRVLAANYINSPTNCLQPTGYYMVCCHNECDDILGKLETRLGQPSATPAEVIATLQTSSLRSGSRMHSPMLRKRLQEVADHHGGRVPIHGRLFAQWLHHVFPNECAYPHKSGSKHPQWILDFEEETGKPSALSDKEMEAFLVNASRIQPATTKTAIADAGSCAPWQDQEELFAPLPHLAHPALHALEDDPHVWGVTAGIAFLAALSTFTISILRTCKSVSKATYHSKMLQV